MPIFAWQEKLPFFFRFIYLWMNPLSLYPVFWLFQFWVLGRIGCTALSLALLDFDTAWDLCPLLTCKQNMTMKIGQFDWASPLKWHIIANVSSFLSFSCFYFTKDVAGSLTNSTNGKWHSWSQIKQVTIHIPWPHMKTETGFKSVLWMQQFYCKSIVIRRLVWNLGKNKMKQKQQKQNNKN